jgi:8-oxo-dGTP diphosphatase
MGRRWVLRVIAPSYTVGAACVIERDDGSVLLVRLVYRNGWGLPGGLVKRHEPIADCARREVREEVGVEVELTSEPAVVVDSRPQRVDVVFRARLAAGADSDEVRPCSAEIREVRWFPAGELPTLQHEAVTALGALAASVRADGPVAAASPSAGRDGGALALAAVAALAQRKTGGKASDAGD